MSRLFKYLLFLFPIIVWSQKIEVSLSKKSIQIGEQVQLSINVQMPIDARFKYEEFQQNFPAHLKENESTLNGEQSDEIEILSPFSDTIKKIGKQKIWTGTYTITAWNEGVFLLSPGNFILNDSSINIENITLHASLLQKKDGVELYDIKEHYAELPTLKENLLNWLKVYFWIPIVFILMILLFIKYLKGKKAKNFVHQNMSLKERTLLAIQALEDEELWNKKQEKKHFIELSFILKSYLSSRYQLNILEATTLQTQGILRKTDIPTDTIKTIASILELADMVKFAKL